MTQSTPPLYTLLTRAAQPSHGLAAHPTLSWGRRSCTWALSALLFSAVAACNGLDAGDPPGTNETSHGDGDGDGDGDGSTDVGDGDTTTDTSTDTTTDTGGDPGSPVIPARIRRLTVSEYNASVQALIGTTTTPAD